MRASWLLSAGAIALSGYVCSSYAHENVAQRVNGDSPGRIAIVYSQRAPGLGKVASLGCAVGVGFCLWKGMQEESVVGVAPANNQQPVLPVGQQAKIFAPPAVAPAAHQYSDEPEIEGDEVVPVSVPAQATPVALTPATASTPDIFDRIYNNHKRHIFIPSETGGGKTTLLLGAMEYIWNLTHKNCEFYGSTSKKTAWLGLEQLKAPDGLGHVITLSPEEPDTVQLLIQRLRWLRKKMVARQNERTKLEQQGKKANFRRVYIILDEWLETLSIAKEYDRAYNLTKSKDDSKSDVLGELKSLVNSFVLCGREDEFCIWLFGQDHQVQNASINTGYRKNFGFIVPARVGGMQGLEEALTGRSPITTPAQGQKLFTEAEQLVLANPETGICYSNIFGHELLVVPYLPDIKRKRIFAEASSAKSKVLQFPKTASGETYQPQEELDDPWNS